MWLLNAKTLALEYVTGPHDIKYAILSHTWGEDEVTFQEVRDGKGKKKRGYQKIINICRQALKDGFDRVWVDTCCINKESSAELTESINSMWRWYCDASLCYAYLEDVSEAYVELSDNNHPKFAPTAINGKVPANVDGHDALSRSRWFTRGWTLQELIAPAKVVFYNHLWLRLGVKDTLLRTLWHITKIDPAVLTHRKYLSGIVAARKMSWAAHRATTRLEDRAYSLLGVFGVNMPLLYGEGENAFIRLQEEIIKTSTDHSIFTWGTLDPLSIRDDELDLLFARSPRDFSHCSKMVRWATGRIDNEFRLTNRGITFESLPTFEDDEEGAFAVLSCRYEDDFGGVLALRLSSGDEDFPMHEIGLKQLRGKDDFWVDGTSLDRLVLYDGSREAQVCSRRITLLRHRPVLDQATLNFDRFDTKPRAPKIWLVNAASTREGFYVVEAHPKELWNHASGVMCPPLETVQPELRRMSALVEGERSKIRFSLAFDAAKLANDGHTLVISSRSPREARGVLVPKTSREAYVDPEGPVPRGISVTSVAPEELYGDNVCKIEIAMPGRRLGAIVLRSPDENVAAYPASLQELLVKSFGNN
ncbi:hypothetical protein PRZ48_012977 [Zasmidium cellare]|uniref:Heterokaryon incompatibility domain-containing protein n=1 Tax=Zasmidium cellare TaxID=395010 RepID=A0ABR0E2Q8_ZASCE|nr:hypothetical protein PRZ48_012977 [Zasmidium cellare]